MIAIFIQIFFTAFFSITSIQKHLTITLVNTDKTRSQEIQM